MSIYYVTKPAEDLNKYYHEQQKLPSPTFDRLIRTVKKDGSLRVVTYSLSETPIPKSWGDFFRNCCCYRQAPSTRSSPHLTKWDAAQYLEEDLDALRPIQKFRKAVKKVIELQLGSGMERMRKNGYKGAMLQQEYWCEAIHPQHYAEKFSSKLFTCWESNRETPYSFTEWLKTRDGKNAHTKSLSLMNKTNEDHSKTDLAAMKIQNPNSQEQFQYRVRMDTKDPSKPKFIRRNGLPLLGINMYVIDSDLKIYAAPKVRNSFHHSSFVGGRAVICAGIVELLDDGTIKQINTLSGHYKPCFEHFKNAMQVLKLYGFKRNYGSATERSASHEDRSLCEWTRNESGLPNISKAQRHRQFLRHLATTNVLLPPSQ